MTDIRTCCRKHWEADTDQHAVAVGDVLLNPVGMHMMLCRTCGNKRCPAATDCSLPCTGSNEPGQDGSVYGGLDDDDYECLACHCLMDVPEGCDELDEDVRYCGPCAIVQIEALRDKLANYREQIEALLKQRDAALARLAVKCKFPEATKCERLWAADHDRLQLEAVDPALAEEFPFGCDTVEHLAVALLAARAVKARGT